MRLFKVGSHFFSNKKEAKEFRDEHKFSCPDMKVSKGPDHKNYGAVQTFKSGAHKQGQGRGKGFPKKFK